MKSIRFRVDNAEIEVPVRDTLFATFKREFIREALTQPQRLRLKILYALMEVAYKQGVADSGKTQ